MKQLIDTIATLCQQANPNYEFIHEEAALINVRVDSLSRDQPFVYVEAVRTGFYTRNRVGLTTKTVNLRVYFSRFAPWTGDTRRTEASPVCERTKEELIDTIENEIVAPFLRLLDTPDARRALTAGQPWARLAFQYPPSRYNANELSVMVELPAVAVANCF